jgi:sarcosine reductase
MALVLSECIVRSARLGAQTGLEQGVLSVAGDAIGAGISARDPRIEGVTVHIVQPGDAARVLCVKDVIEPRCKTDGAAIGAGTTRVLKNVGVVTCGPIVGFQEGIIDLSGPGAAYTPFSEHILIVIEVQVAEGTPPHEHEALLRSAGLAVAEQLARDCESADVDRVETLEWDERKSDSGLPRIAYVDMVLSQGLLHDTWVLGRNAGNVLPCKLDPLVMIDGGVVSGNCVSACDKTTTFHHQNNPVIRELLAGHGSRWDFAGVVMTNEPTRLAAKQHCAERAVELVRELEAAAAIITKEGFGNPDADLMMIVRALETAGIKTVAITDEFAGTDGASQSLADTTPEADALVSVGNANAVVELPAMQTVIGPTPDVARLAGGYAQSVHEDGSMTVELQAIIGSTNQLGFGRLSCREI